MISSGHITCLLAWFREHARPLPWRENPPNPYHVWLSEVMLQQTRIEAVTEAYRRVLETCPTVEDLAALSQEALLKLWQGLGYYSRARHLHEAARRIVEEGGFPGTWEGWRALPGVGEYTAAAVGAIVLGERHPAVDGNVVRVLSRLLAREISPLQARELLGKGMEETDSPSAFAQAWMELGRWSASPMGVPAAGNVPWRKGAAPMPRGRRRPIPLPAVVPPVPATVSRSSRFFGRMGGLPCVVVPPGGCWRGCGSRPMCPGAWGFPAPGRPFPPGGFPGARRSCFPFPPPPICSPIRSGA